MTDEILQRRERWRRVWGAIAVAWGIASGAFAAHAITEPVAADWMRTAGLYMMIHGVAVIVLADGRYRTATKLMFSGACLFAVTLSAMAAGGPHWLGAVTPIGGVLMIAGWICVAWTEFRRR